MTMYEIVRSDTDVLLPKDIAPILGVDPHSIRVAARQAPERLGFTVCVIGTRTLIPRRAFLKWLYGREEDIQDDRAYDT